MLPLLHDNLTRRAHQSFFTIRKPLNFMLFNEFSFARHLVEDILRLRVRQVWLSEAFLTTGGSSVKLVALPIAMAYLWIPSLDCKATRLQVSELRTR